MGDLTELNKMSTRGYWRTELLERLQLKHEPFGSVKELHVGARLWEVTELEKMTLRVERL